MPAKSQQQMKFIYAMRSKYGTKKKAPKNMKWVFDSEWTSGIKMKKLPKTMKKNESIIKFSSFVNENYEYENFTMSDMEYVKDLYDDGMTDPREIAIECEGIFNNNCTGDECVAMVNQILYSLRKSGSIDKKKKNICSSCDDFDCENCEGCDCECCGVSENVKTMDVDYSDDDEPQPRLNIETTDGKKFYINLKSFNDFDDEW